MKNTKISDCFRSATFLFVFLTTILLGFSTQAVAQTIKPLSGEPCSGAKYHVKDGDILYVKYGPTWNRLIGLNPGLPKRIFTQNGKTIAMLYPSRHDVLCIPTGMTTSEIFGGENPELSRDPITSGTPYVPGGINVDEPDRLEKFFDDQAVSRSSNKTIRPVRISPIEKGMISGEGLVGYLGGEPKPRRITTPIRGYQARYRFSDGSEEVLQNLQGCMNPIGNGGEVYRGFTFTPDSGNSVVVPLKTAKDNQVLNWWQNIPWWGWLIVILSLLGISGGVYSFFSNRSNNRSLLQKEETEKLVAKEKTETTQPATSAATSESVAYTPEQEDAAKNDGFPSAAVKARHDNFVESMFVSPLPNQVVSEVPMEESTTAIEEQSENKTSLNSENMEPERKYISSFPKTKNQKAKLQFKGVRIDSFDLLPDGSTQIRYTELD